VLADIDQQEARRSLHLSILEMQPGAPLPPGAGFSWPKNGFESFGVFESRAVYQQ